MSRYFNFFRFENTKMTKYNCLNRLADYINLTSVRIIDTTTMMATSIQLRYAINSFRCFASKGDVAIVVSHSAIYIIKLGKLLEYKNCRAEDETSRAKKLAAIGGSSNNVRMADTMSRIKAPAIGRSNCFASAAIFGANLCIAVQKSNGALKLFTHAVHGLLAAEEDSKVKWVESKVEIPADGAAHLDEADQNAPVYVQLFTSVISKPTAFDRLPGWIKRRIRAEPDGDRPDPVAVADALGQQPAPAEGAMDCH